ncbi:MAG TPA: hypothetical protein ENJ18_07285 [Nannocystis exedens]|nr:hypothetical protein [Nannocystis exedens]
MTSIHALLIPFSCSLALLACNGDDGGSTTQGTTAENTTVTVTAGSSSSGMGSSSSSGETTSSSSSGETTLGSTSGGESTGSTGVSASATMTGSTSEATTTTTTTTGEPEGCKKVDFLFVIDNSVSMQGEQAALKAAFPAFIETIQQTLPTSDYHIMVADTDAEGRCSPETCTHSTCKAAKSYACQDIFVECDTIRGAGVNHPAGEAASNMPCEFFGGNRYLLSDDPKLVDNFSCAASVGLAGHPKERPMDGIVEALSPALNDAGGCNEGFLRDDAILVVTFLSDDPKVEDVNTAVETYDAVVAAKGGDEDRIVMLGLIPQPDMGCGNGGAHWSEMVGFFGERGIEGAICSEDYNAFFQDAVSTILDTCIINPG